MLISEVFYDQIGDLNDEDWIEVYNASGSAVDLSDYKLGDEETPGKSEGMMRFPGGSWITAGQVIVIATQADAFLREYGFLPDYELSASILEVPDMVPYSTWSSGQVTLDDNSDEVLLLDGYDNVADVVAYGYSLYPDFQPPVEDVIEGWSIERSPADRDTDSSSDWIAQPAPNPGVVYLSPEVVDWSGRYWRLTGEGRLHN